MAASNALMEIGDDKLRDLFPSIQVGVAVKGGTERALHLVQSWLEIGDSRHVFIKVDFKNAFNSCSRERMLRSFLSQETLAPAWNLFRWAYSEPSPLLFYNLNELAHVISSSEGGRQGDLLMPLAFANLVQPLYQSAVREGVSLVADLDGLGIEGPADQAFAALDHILESSPQYQLSANLAKTRVFSFNRTPRLERECIKRGIQLEKKEVMEWLGALVGNLDSEDARNGRSTKWKRSTFHFFTKLFYTL